MLEWLISGTIPVPGGALGAREVVGNLFGLASAILGMRRLVWAWPVGLVGNVLLGAAIWRSGVLPRWTAAAWIVAALLMYPLGLLVAAAVTGSTPPTVLVGALLVCGSGGWIAWCVQRGGTGA